MIGDVDDKDDSNNSKFNPNFIFNSSSTIYFLLFSFFLLLSPTNKNDGIGDIFRNNDPTFQEIDSKECVDDDDDDDDLWVSIGSIFYLLMKSFFPPLSIFHYSTSLLFCHT